MGLGHAGLTAAIGVLSRCVIMPNPPDTDPPPKVPPPNMPAKPSVYGGQWGEGGKPNAPDPPPPESPDKAATKPPSKS